MRKLDIDPMDVPRLYWDESTLGNPEAFMAMISLMRLSRRMNATIDEVLDDYGVSRNAYLLLMHLELSESGSRILSSLARDLLVHPTTITLTIDRLEAEGYVKKTPHETDRRATRASMTRSGRAFARKITAELSEHGFGLGALSRPQAAKLEAVVSAARLAIGDGNT